MPRINFNTMPSAECRTLRPVAHILPLFSSNTIYSLNWQTIRKYPNYLPLIPNNSIKMLFETDFIHIFPGTRTNIKSKGTAFCITCNITGAENRSHTKAHAFRQCHASRSVCGLDIFLCSLLLCFTLRLSSS